MSPHTVLRDGRLIPFLARFTAIGGTWQVRPGPAEWHVEDLAKARTSAISSRRVTPSS